MKNKTWISFYKPAGLIIDGNVAYVCSVSGWSVFILNPVGTFDLINLDPCLDLGSMSWPWIHVRLMSSIGCIDVRLTLDPWLTLDPCGNLGSMSGQCLALVVLIWGWPWIHVQTLDPCPDLGSMSWPWIHVDPGSLFWPWILVPT